MTYPTLQRLFEFRTRTKPRAIIMAGGPGAGKSTVVRNIISGTRAKWVDVDQISQLLARKMNRPIKDVGDDVHPIAREKNNRRRDYLMNSRVDLIIDGTGRDLAGTRKLKDELESRGYETAMVFVATSLETALTRNKQREKEVDSKMAEEYWHAVMQNLRPLHTMFDHFFYVKNDETPSQGAIIAANKFLQ